MADPLHLHELGPADGAPLLFVHGVTGHGGRWRRFAAEHLAAFRVLAPDLRGHGQSPRVPPWTLEQHAADLLAVLDRAGLDEVPVVGHSFGGLAAIHLARLAPRRVTRLVLLDPAAHVEPELALEYAEAAAKVCATREEAVAAQRYDWPDVPDEVVEEEVGANWAEAGGQWRPRFSPASVAAAWSEMCRAAQVPPPGVRTLLVPAEQETYVRAEYVGACRIALGDDLVVHGLDCGHMLHHARPAELADLIRGFVGGQ